MRIRQWSQVLSMRLGYPFRGKLAWGSLAVVLVGAILTIGGIGAGVDQLGIAIGALSPLTYAIYIILAAWMAGERPARRPICVPRARARRSRHRSPER